jgi:hypothetical protein
VPQTRHFDHAWSARPGLACRALWDARRCDQVSSPEHPELFSRPPRNGRYALSDFTGRLAPMRRSERSLHSTTARRSGAGDLCSRSGAFRGSEVREIGRSVSVPEGNSWRVAYRRQPSRTAREPSIWRVGRPRIGDRYEFTPADDALRPPDSCQLTYLGLGCRCRPSPGARHQDRNHREPRTSRGSPPYREWHRASARRLAGC